MHASLIALTFFALLGQAPHAPTGRVVTLALPHALRAGETAWIEVKVGVLEHKAEIEIETTAGQPLGVISPFGIRAGHPSGTYTVPLPAEAISHDRVSLRLFLDENGHPHRAPTPKEVTGVRVKIMPAAR
jgi:hypothetical protein